MWEAWHQAGSPRSAWMSTAISAAALAHGLAGTGEFDLWRSRALEMARMEDAASSPVLAPFAAFVDARVAVHTRAHRQAAALVERAFAPFAVRWYEAYARAAGAELAVVAGLPDAAERLAAAMPYAEQNDWAAACLARTSGILHGDRDALAEAVERWTSIDARFERACTLRLLPGRKP
ncbi:hypothetical protein AB0L65_40330 [Nonomuraea sp. NPDC052116]|uniref:hypothetical protein n=1 Tax=Nonomuraea sp. NPDC052116 TaxID=3155665 RepID=UPI00344511C5